jgi:hypothetical protein
MVTHGVCGHDLGYSLPVANEVRLRRRIGQTLVVAVALNDQGRPDLRPDARTEGEPDQDDITTLNRHGFGLWTS